MVGYTPSNDGLFNDIEANTPFFSQQNQHNQQNSQNLQKNQEKTTKISFKVATTIRNTQSLVCLLPIPRVDAVRFQEYINKNNITRFSTNLLKSSIVYEISRNNHFFGKNVNFTEYYKILASNNNAGVVNMTDIPHNYTEIDQNDESIENFVKNQQFFNHFWSPEPTFFDESGVFFQNFDFTDGQFDEEAIENELLSMKQYNDDDYESFCVENGYNNNKKLNIKNQFFLNLHQKQLQLNPTTHYNTQYLLNNVVHVPLYVDAVVMLQNLPFLFHLPSAVKFSLKNDIFQQQKTHSASPTTQSTYPSHIAMIWDNLQYHTYCYHPQTRVKVAEVRVFSKFFINTIENPVYFRILDSIYTNTIAEYTQDDERIMKTLGKQFSLKRWDVQQVFQCQMDMVVVGEQEIKHFQQEWPLLFTYYHLSELYQQKYYNHHFPSVFNQNNKNQKKNNNFEIQQFLKKFENFEKNQKNQKNQKNHDS